MQPLLLLVYLAMVCYITVYLNSDRMVYKFLTNCGPPGGYIFPYNSTLEGASVEFACQQAGNLTTTMTAVCNHRGARDTNPAQVCESGYIL